MIRKLKNDRAALALLLLWFAYGSAVAVDAELMEQYRAHKARQQTQLLVEQEMALEQARAALSAGDLAAAQSRLADLRAYGYAAAELAVLEDRVKAGRRAQEERQRQERIAREARERAYRARLAAAAREREQTAAAEVRTGRLISSLDWGYGYDEVHVPPTYETKLKDRGFFFRDYYFETRQKSPGFTVTDLEEVYFAVRLKNPTDQPMRVTYRITAREEFSVGRAVGTTANAAGWGLVGAALGGLLGGDEDSAKAGAALGGAYGLSRQAERNEWFEKSRTFSVTLKPGQETYETGKFPVSKRLSNAPKLKIVSVD